MSYLNVQIGKANVKDLAKMFNKLCVTSKEFANGMVGDGLHGNVVKRNMV